MKKDYNAPEAEVVMFEGAFADVMCTSTGASKANAKSTPAAVSEGPNN